MLSTIVWWLLFILFAATGGYQFRKNERSQAIIDWVFAAVTLVGAIVFTITGGH